MNFLKFLFALAFACATMSMANPGITAQINGEKTKTTSTSPCTVPFPSTEFNLSASVNPDQSGKSFEWKILSEKFNDGCTEQNPSATLKPSGGNASVVLPYLGEVKIKCTITYDGENGTRNTIDTPPVTLEYSLLPTLPTPTVSISGSNYAHEKESETYEATCTGLEGRVPTYKWSYKDFGGSEHSVEGSGNKVKISFDKFGIKKVLCNVEYPTGEENNKTANVSADKDVRVYANIEFDISRKNYSGGEVSMDKTAYIHWNIDNDAEIKEDTQRPRVYDYETEIFPEGKTDDDLCLLKINNYEDFCKAGIGSFQMTVPKGYKVWKDQRKAEDSLLGNGGSELSWSLENAAENKTFEDLFSKEVYVEGCKNEEINNIFTFSYGRKTVTLAYAQCSAGDRECQPLLSNRKDVKRHKEFSELVDCEWAWQNDHVSSAFYKSYNCIAYAADPDLEKFNKTSVFRNNNEGTFWVIDSFGPSLKVNPQTNQSEDNFCVGPGFGQINFKTFKSITNTLQNAEIPFYADPYPNMPLVCISLNDFDKLSRNLQILFNVRYLAMHSYNTDDTSGKFDKKNDPDFFFENTIFGNLKECDVNSSERKVVYYDLFHAARTYLGLKGTKYEDSKLSENCHPKWKMLSSKTGQGPIIWHREEQLSKIYGTVVKAYK